MAFFFDSLQAEVIYDVQADTTHRYLSMHLTVFQEDHKNQCMAVESCDIKGPA